MSRAPALGFDLSGVPALEAAPSAPPAAGVAPPESKGFARELRSHVRASRPAEEPGPQEPPGTNPWAMLPALLPLPVLGPPLSGLSGTHPHERSGLAPSGTGEAPTKMAAPRPLQALDPGKIAQAPVLRPLLAELAIAPDERTPLRSGAADVQALLTRDAIIAWETHVTRHAHHGPVLDTAATAREALPSQQPAPTRELARSSPEEIVPVSEGTALGSEHAAPEVAVQAGAAAPSEPGPVRPPIVRDSQPVPELVEAPLPPALEREQVRIRLDRQLSVEISAQGHRVEVTLRGSAVAIEPLKAIAPELDQSLRQDGLLLESFQARSDGQGEAASGQQGQQGEPSPRRQEEPEDTITIAPRSTRSRGLPRGGRYA